MAAYGQLVLHRAEAAIARDRLQALKHRQLAQDLHKMLTLSNNQSPWSGDDLNRPPKPSPIDAVRRAGARRTLQAHKKALQHMTRLLRRLRWRRGWEAVTHFRRRVVWGFIVLTLGSELVFDALPIPRLWLFGALFGWWLVMDVLLGPWLESHLKTSRVVAVQSTIHAFYDSAIRMECLLALAQTQTQHSATEEPANTALEPPARDPVA
jgi:hypothetical protein